MSKDSNRPAKPLLRAYKLKRGIRIPEAWIKQVVSAWPKFRRLRQITWLSRVEKTHYIKPLRDIILRPRTECCDATVQRKVETETHWWSSRRRGDVYHRCKICSRTVKSDGRIDIGTRLCYTSNFR